MRLMAVRRLWRIITGGETAAEHANRLRARAPQKRCLFNEIASFLHARARRLDRRYWIMSTLAKLMIEAQRGS